MSEMRQDRRLSRLPPIRSLVGIDHDDLAFLVHHTIGPDEVGIHGTGDVARGGERAERSIDRRANWHGFAGWEGPEEVVVSTPNRVVELFDVAIDPDDTDDTRGTSRVHSEEQTLRVLNEALDDEGRITPDVGWHLSTRRDEVGEMVRNRLAHIGGEHRGSLAPLLVGAVVLAGRRS